MVMMKGVVRKWKETMLLTKVMMVEVVSKLEETMLCIKEKVGEGGQEAGRDHAV
jgi:hypothetical protein